MSTFTPATIKKLPRATRDALAKWSTPRQCGYAPHVPHPPQQLFLCLDQWSEVFYGGAAGGGKSDAILQAALQYVDVPGYSALILRRTYPDLSLPGAIMDRAREWLANTDAQERQGGRLFTFPSGAKLSFGHLQYDRDKYRYQSSEFQFIAFDELTQFEEQTYEYLFSRLRRPALTCSLCNRQIKRSENFHWVHTRSEGKPVWETEASPTRLKCPQALPDHNLLNQYKPASDGVTLFHVPLRMRSASNPGGLGHSWVRERFVDPRTRKPGAVFIPASLNDNPSLDQQSYVSSLEHLGPVDRARLLQGDWDVLEEGAMFQRYWFPAVEQGPNNPEQSVRFWDMAATPDGDYTVGARMSMKDNTYYVEDIVRGRWTPHQAEVTVQQTARSDGIGTRIRMEQEPGASGVGQIEMYRRTVLPGFDFRGVRSVGSKMDRARALSSMSEPGDVKLVAARWNRDLLDELSVFPHGAHDDQVDAVCGAFNELQVRRRGRIVV